MKRTLACMPHGQAYVEVHPSGRKELISYTTKVAEISEDGWLHIYGLHSQTTKRHIVAFIDEYAHGLKSKHEQSLAHNDTYQQMVAAYTAGRELDISDLNHFREV